MDAVADINTASSRKPREIPAVDRPLRNLERGQKGADWQSPVRKSTERFFKRHHERAVLQCNHCAQQRDLASAFEHVTNRTAAMPIVQEPNPTTEHLKRV